MIKWETFRANKENAIQKYVKIKRNTQAFTTLIAMIVAHKFVIKVNKNYREKIALIARRARMMFFLKIQLMN